MSGPRSWPESTGTRGALYGGRTALAPVLDAHRLLLCVGSGGVGKTTSAAALGLAGARRGRRAAVLTIDPARRLKDALGIKALDGEPHRVPLERLKERPSGTLDAMLLDAKRTFDGLIRHYAPSDAAAERVLANRIYQSVSTTLAGSQEYMAMERLHAIASDGAYDLLVVDTPPTQHALDFLEAPERLSALLSSRAAVLTIDPARRLKDALGIKALDGEPHRVPLERLKERPSGTLDAMLLDAKRTFDDLIRRYAPSSAAAERVLANRIYQSVSTTLAGSQEYMAMERLHAIASDGAYDLLVVDTPPTQHALDFLEAPERLSALLSSRAAAILQNPTLILSRESSKLAQAALAAVLRGLERFTGLELLRDVAEFVAGIETFSAGFQSRAAQVNAFLRSRETSFLLVTTPEAARVAETLAFHAELVRAGLPFGGFVVNRVLPAALVGESITDPEREAREDVALARKLVAVHRRYALAMQGERAEIARLEDAARGAPVVEIPLQTEEPTSLPGLASIAAALDG